VKIIISFTFSVANQLEFQLWFIKA